VGLLVLLHDFGEPGPDVGGAGLLDFHRMGGAAQVEAGLERHALALIGPVVHPLLPARLGQSLVAQPRPHGPDEFHGIREGPVPLDRDGVQLADLLTQRSIRQDRVAGHQDVQMGVVRLAVEADVHPDAKGIRQPAPEPLGQRGFLDPAEPSRQGRIDLTRHHGVPAPMVGLHGIPEGLALHRGAPSGQDQGERGDVGLEAVVRHQAGPRIHHPGPGPVGAGRHRRPPLRPPEDRHRQMKEGWGRGLHGGLLGVRGACPLRGVGGPPPDRTYFPWGIL